MHFDRSAGLILGEVHWSEGALVRTAQGLTTGLGIGINYCILGGFWLWQNGIGLKNQSPIFPAAEEERFRRGVRLSVCPCKKQSQLKTHFVISPKKQMSVCHKKL